MFLWLRIRYWLTQEEPVRREHSRRVKLSWGWYIGANRCGVRFQVLFRWRERDNRTELALLVSLIAPVVKCAKITRAWQLDPNTSSSSSSPWEPACQELRKRRAHFNWALKLYSASRAKATLARRIHLLPLSLSLPLTHSLVYSYKPSSAFASIQRKKNWEKLLLYGHFTKQFRHVFFWILLFVLSVPVRICVFF